MPFLRSLIIAATLLFLAGCSDDSDPPPPVPSPTATSASAPSPSSTPPAASSPTATSTLLEEPEPTATAAGPTPTATSSPPQMCPTLGTPSPTMPTNTPATGTPTVTPTCLVTPVPDELGQYGSDQELANSTVAAITLPPYALTTSGVAGTLPDSVLLTNLPSISMQGTFGMNGFPGSCEAQSFGYGLGSYTAARNPDGSPKWSAAEPQNQVSAAYLFALAQSMELATCAKGGALIYLEQLVSIGAPSAAEVPYQPYCCYFNEIDVNMSYPDEGRFRIGSYTSYAVPNQSAAQQSVLELLKRLLAAGHAIAFSGPVFHGYANPTLTNGVFVATTGALIPDSGHGQLLVGYDDDKGDSGAFLVQNSFGPCWPPIEPGGFLWWSYDTFIQSQTLTAVAYPLADTPPTGTQLTGSVGGVDAYVTQVNHWVNPIDPEHVYAIVQLQFTGPVLINSIVLIEPGTGTTVTQSFNQPMANGYAYIERLDGHQFVNGSYGLEIDVTVGSTIGEFSGAIAVGQSVPTAPTPAPIGTTTILGTNGQAAAVTPGSESAG